MFIDGEAEAQSKLGVVLKQGVGPCRTAPLFIVRPRRGGKIASVNRTATGRIGDHGTVTKERGKQLEVRRLAATAASPGELKERVQQLNILHHTGVQFIAIHIGDFLEKFPVLFLRRAKGHLQRHIKSLFRRILLVLCGAIVRA